MATIAQAEIDAAVNVLHTNGIGAPDIEGFVRKILEAAAAARPVDPDFGVSAPIEINQPIAPPIVDIDNTLPPTPPGVENTLPEGPPVIDNELPEEEATPDNELPEEEATPKKKHK